MELGERGRRLRDVRPHVGLHLFLGGFFLVGSAFVTWLSFVAERDPRSSALLYVIPVGLVLVGSYAAWIALLRAARLLRTRLVLFDGGFELHRANIVRWAPWRDVERVELRSMHHYGAGAVTIHVIALVMHDGRIIELSRMMPDPERLAIELGTHVARGAHP